MSCVGTVALIDVKLTPVGNLYARHASVAAVPSTCPGIVDGDVARTYTYHVPDGNVTETDAELDTSVPAPHCVSPALVVRPVRPDDAP